MSILIFIIAVLVTLSLAFYVISLLPLIPQPFKLLIQIMAILCGVLAICNRMGWI